MTKKTIPDTIFLQAFGDSSIEEVGDDETLHEVTWSEERIWPGDIEYKRVHKENKEENG